MRHERLLNKDSYSRIVTPAAWTAPQLVPVPTFEIEEREPPRSEAPGAGAAESFMPTPAAPDVPAAVGVLIFAAYAALIAAFAVATTRSAESFFAITVSALFVVAYFTVPRIFFGVEPNSGRRPSFDRFMHEGLQTLTGHSTGRDALVQMLIVPVLLTFAALAMGVAAACFL